MRLFLTALTLTVALALSGTSDDPSPSTSSTVASPSTVPEGGAPLPCPPPCGGH